MILRLVLFLALLLWGAPAHAAITFGQEVHCAIVGSTTCTTSGATTSGNLFVAQTGWYTAAGFTSVTDSKSNTWSNVIAELDDAGGVTAGRVDATTGATSGASHTFTLTITTGTATLSVIEVRGAAATTPLDKTATAAENSGTSHTTASTATTTQANEILLGFGTSTDMDTGNTFTQTGTGWTQAFQNNPFMALISGYRVVSATGAYPYTYTTSVSARAVNMISTWKEAAAAAGVRQRCVGCGADGKVIE